MLQDDVLSSVRTHQLQWCSGQVTKGLNGIRVVEDGTGWRNGWAEVLVPHTLMPF